MKKNSYKQFCFFLVTIVIISTLTSSCTNRKNKVNCFELSKSFDNANWIYDQRIVEFEIELQASEFPRQILIELDLSQKLAIDKLPMAFSIYAPSGAASHKPVTFYFSQYPELNSDTPFTSKIISTTVYPQKFFNETGIYKIRLLQKSTKYDLYGINSVRVKSIVAKSEKDGEK